MLRAAFAIMFLLLLGCPVSCASRLAAKLLTELGADTDLAIDAISQTGRLPIVTDAHYAQVLHCILHGRSGARK